MKKLMVSLLLVSLLFTQSAFVFADTKANTIPYDIEGKNCEEAVKALIEQNIVSGYEDGTFQPDKTINRAEASILVVKSKNPASLNVEKKVPFQDMKGYLWASDYINYAFENKIIAGYEDGTFRPGNQVTYLELAAMVLNSLGYKATDLTGTWPNNYFNKATELGLFKELGFEVTLKNCNDTAIRGNVALIVYHAQKINKPEQPQDKPENKEDTQNEQAGKLADFTGNASGLILDYASVVNADGNSVTQVKFLMGDNIYYLNTTTSCDIPQIQFDGTLYTLKMVKGNVKVINTKGENLKHFAELTDGDWEEVKSKNNYYLKVSPANKDLGIMEDAIFYKAVFKGDDIDKYEKAGLNDIREGAMIRAYDVTDDKTDNADVVVIVDDDDASKIKIK